METDHEALEKIRKKPYFQMYQALTWIEKIMEFNFNSRYSGAKISLANELSREKEISDEEIQVKMKND